VPRPLDGQRKERKLGGNPKQERRQAHALLDMLPDEKLSAVRSLLEVMVEPLSRSLALALAEEEEELTPETAAARDRARGSLVVKAFHTMKSCGSSA
jgi:ethanolamine utilization microcompartment shell protein EutL